MSMIEELVGALKALDVEKIEDSCSMCRFRRNDDEWPCHSCRVTGAWDDTEETSKWQPSERAKAQLNARKVIAQAQASLAEPVTPRAKLIRDAKALIRALKLPVGGGVAFWNCDWWVCNEQPKASLYSWSFGDNASAWTLPRNLFQEYPGDWKDSFITIDTPEQGGE